MKDKIDMREQLEKLVLLQNIDSDIYDIVAQLDSFPERLADLDESLESKKIGMENAENELSDLKVKQNGHEVDMQAKEEQIQKHDSQLYQIKNNKEYSALKQEIESIKADVSIIEEDIIKLMDGIEAQKAKKEEEKRIFLEETKESEKIKAEIKAEEGQLRQKMNDSEINRAKALEGLQSEILGQYESIRESRGRTAIAKVKENFCSECRMQLRPQIINDAKLKKEIVLCEACWRILYAED